MNNELIINVVASEIVIALLEDKQLVELSREKNNKQFAVGDIYLGKVKKIMPGLNAVFVDVGYEKDAFLHYLDLGPQFQNLQNFQKFIFNAAKKPAHERNAKQLASLNNVNIVADIDKSGKITDVVQPGQSLLVQVAKEPISAKGPRISTDLTMAGRHLVLIPFTDKVSVSKKIKSQEERMRLKKVIMSIKPKNFGVIVRTVAEGKKVQVLDMEVRELYERWEALVANAMQMHPPSLIVSEIDRTSAMLRDMLGPDFTNIWVNEPNIYREIKDYIEVNAPEKAKIVKLYNQKPPIFDYFGINRQIKLLFGKTVPFKNGAYLIIEHTEALHVIDVNSGNRSREGDQESNALDVNMAAALEISRQLRLRDMGGIIVVDFIDMRMQEHKQQLFEYLKTVMSKDRTKHNILPPSKFGLVQITRQRVRPETHIKTDETCPTCNGNGRIAPSILFIDQIENNLKYLHRFSKTKVLTLKAHPYVAAYLTTGFPSIRMKWMWKYKCWIKVKAGTENYTFLEYHYFDQNNEEILL